MFFLLPLVSCYVGLISVSASAAGFASAFVFESGEDCDNEAGDGPQRTERAIPPRPNSGGVLASNIVQISSTSLVTMFR